MNNEIISKKISIWKLKLANHLMSFCLDKKINNYFLIDFIFFIYQRLAHNSYVLEHKLSNHHYIPVFLLKEFKISEGLIFQYARSKKPKAVSIKKEAACIKNLYSFKDKVSKGKSDFIENQIFAFTLEKYASRIIHQIIKDKDIDEKITNLERSILMSYIAFQYVRTPRFLYFIRLVLQYLHLEKNISMDEVAKADFYKKAFFENYYQINSQEMYDFGIKNKLDLCNAKDLILRLSIQIGDDLSSIIYKRKMHLLVAQQPAFFYLSDSPAEIFNCTKGRSVGPFLWEIEKNPLIFMPIAPDLCLYFLKGVTIPSPHIIGMIIETALPGSIYEFAFADRKSNKIIHSLELNI